MKRSHLWAVGMAVLLAALDALLLGWIWQRHRVSLPVGTTPASASASPPTATPMQGTPLPLPPPNVLSERARPPKRPQAVQNDHKVHPMVSATKISVPTVSRPREKRICRAKVGNEGVLVPCPEDGSAGESLPETREELEATYNQWHKEHHPSSHR